MDRISVILKKYISERIPKKATNIFWQLFNGVEAMFVNLEYRLDIVKRERNMLTAQSMSSLRHLAAENGFEPTLKIPARGILNIKIDSRLFNRVGYPLFIPPYSIFQDKTTKLNYYYNSDKSFRLSNNTCNILVIEGEIKQKTYISLGKLIERIYLSEDNISENSITIEVNGIRFVEVKSFFDNEGLNDDKQFIVKFSNNMQIPIVLYVKGLELNDTVNVIYRTCSGELGNIIGNHEFETQNIINNLGSIIDVADDEIIINNIAGFDFGSNGTDENSLRAAIGYNHGKNLLFDNTSYTNFLYKYSTLLIQKIINSPTEKTINFLYLSKKQSINIDNVNKTDYILQYKNIINNNSYLLNKSEKLNLSKILDEFEYALSSHVIYDAKICNFAFQVTMEKQSDILNHKDNLNALLYSEFAKFMYIKNHYINIETLFENFMLENNIKFTYMIFNQLNEEKKLKEKKNIFTEYIIKHDDFLPILNGNFTICDSNFNPIQLFFDTNIIAIN